MARAIFDVANQRGRFAESLQERLDYFYILALVACAYVVNGTRKTFLKR
jgi:hypothetical protein